MDRAFLDRLREGMGVDRQSDQGESILSFQDLLSCSSADDHQLLRKISLLDIGCENLSHDFDSKAVHLVDNKESLDQSLQALTDQFAQEDNNNLVLSCTNNIHLMKGAWAYILRLDECMRVHLRNAANYHEFFYEIDEYEKSMNHIIPKLISLVECEVPDANIEDGQKLLQRTKNVVFAIYFFYGKVMELYERSRAVVPVSKRTDGSADGIPVVSLCAYKNKQIEFKQGEDLSLLLNKDVQLWRVKNSAGQVGDVPSPIILIPGPDNKALNAAFQLQVQFLGQWMNVIKSLGKYILLYLVKVFSYWKSQKVDVLRCLSSDSKEEIKSLVVNARDTFLTIWAKCPGYTRMDEDGVYVTELFMQVGGGKVATDDAQVTDIVEVSRAMMSMVTTYQELLDKWRRYAMLVQMGNMPDQLLMVKGWEEWQLTSFDDLITRWQKYMLDGDSSWWSEWMKWMEEWETNLTLMNSGGGGDGGDGADGGDGGMEEEMLERQTISTTQAAPMEAVTVGVSDETETAESESVTRSESETQTKIEIIGCMDPWTEEDVDFTTAVKKGYIDMNRNVYYNPRTRQSMPLPMAANEGFVMIEIRTIQKTEEKTTSFGVITITLKKETRPYSIISVMDTDTDVPVSVSEAEATGILNIARQTFLDKEEKATMSISDAIDCGLIEVEYEGEGGECEEETRTYAVHGVIDRKANKKLQYNEAVQAGILNPDEGFYLDTSTGNQIFMGEAISKGFIKARKVDNKKNMLELDPNNTAVNANIQKLKTRMKMFTALKGLAK